MPVPSKTRSHHEDVFVSATTRDLKSHRSAAVDAAWRADMYALTMDRDSAVDAAAIDYSLSLVDQAEIFVGIMGLRYGYIPVDPERNPKRLSITELEYHRAVKNGAYVLMFLISEDHPVKRGEIETDPDSLKKLNRFRSHVEKHHKIVEFRSVKDLGEKVYQALVSRPVRDFLQDKAEQADTTPTRRKLAHLPTPPRPYFPHTYGLPVEFVGRTRELSLIDSWAESDSCILVLEALGGVGKSALTWHWLDRRCENGDRSGIRGFDGGMWWSFYEVDSGVDNLITHALSYISGEPAEFIHARPRQERQTELLNLLRSQRYLFVLDGIERVLIGYQRVDEFTEAQSSDLEARYRRLEEQADEDFLRKLLTCGPSKFLVSTRLTPMAWLTPAFQPIQGARVEPLRGLELQDALSLLERQGIQGKQADMVRFINQFDGHSLILNIVAGMVLNYRPAPGDFDQWLHDKGQHLQLSDLNLKQNHTHILKHAFEGLDPSLRKLITVIAQFRRPIDYRTLTQAGMNPYLPENPTPAEQEQAFTLINAALSALENRGLLQWDRRTNRYDLHPIVRNYAHDMMDEPEKHQTIERIFRYFASIPQEDLSEVRQLSDLDRAMDYYDLLVRGGHHDTAIEYYEKQLKQPLMYQFARYDKIIELLEPLFPPRYGDLPRLSTWRGKNTCLTDAATALHHVGDIELAVRLRGMKIKAALEFKRVGSLGVGLRSYANSLRADLNQLAAALLACELALEVAQAARDNEGIAMSNLSLLTLYRDMGRWDAAEAAYQEFHRIANSDAHARRQVKTWLIAVERFYAEMWIMRGFDATDTLEKAAQQTEQRGSGVDRREIYRLQAELALLKGDYHRAAGLFQDSNDLADHSGVPAAPLLARQAVAYARAGEQREARRLLESALNQQQGRVYDLYVSAAEVYHLLGDLAQAAEYAQRAYQEAWVEGPPYVRAWDLERAEKILQHLRLAPQMPAERPKHKDTLPWETDIRQFIDDLKAGRISGDPGAD